MHCLKEKMPLKEGNNDFTYEWFKIQQAHVLYLYEKIDAYVLHAYSFIKAGIEQGYHLFIIENERMFPLIDKKLKHSLKKEEYACVHYVNNFDFYCLGGNFNSSTILSYFSTIIQKTTKDNKVRTWAHVEWGNVKDISNAIGDFECKANIHVNEMEVLSVCCYRLVDVPDSLRENLLNSHDVHMSDKHFHIVKQ